MDSKDHCGIVQVNPEDFEVSKVSEAVEEAKRIATIVADRCHGDRKPNAAPTRRAMIWQAAFAGALEALSRRAAGDDVGRLREALRPFAYAFEQASIDGPCLSLEDVQAMFNLVSIYDFRKAHAAALTSAGDDVGRLREALERISSLSSLSFGFEAREIARAAIDALTGRTK